MMFKYNRYIEDEFTDRDVERLKKNVKPLLTRKSKPILTTRPRAKSLDQMSDTGSEPGDIVPLKKGSPSRTNRKNIFTFGNLLTFFQVLAQTFSVIIILFIVSFLIFTFIKDINIRKNMAKEELSTKMEACRINFNENNCVAPVPFMIEKCLEWEQCMHQNPNNVVTSLSTIQLFADIVEGFVDSLSVRTLAYCGILLILTILITKCSGCCGVQFQNRSTEHKPQNSTITLNFDGLQPSLPAAEGPKLLT
ncbi:hypothetical protein PCE1_002659 [Barthelona sp. PCE]